MSEFSFLNLGHMGRIRNNFITQNDYLKILDKIL